MKPSFFKVLAVAAASLALLISAQSQTLPTPPPPPVQSIETMASESILIGTGTISDFDTSPRRWNPRSVTIVLKNVLKGVPTHEVQVQIDKSAEELAAWKLHGDLILVGVAYDVNRAPTTVINLSDPTLVVFTADLKLLKTQAEVLNAVKAAIQKDGAPKPKPAPVYELKIPQKLIAGTSLQVPPNRHSAEKLRIPIADVLQEDARKVIRSDYDINARASAVDALAYFRNDASIDLLRRLLGDPQYMVIGDPSYSGGMENREFTVRSHAYDLLSSWGIAPTKPALSEKVSRIGDLQTIYFGKQVSDDDIRALRRSRKLRTLGFFTDGLTPKQVEKIGQITQVQTLSLMLDHITDDDLPLLKGLKGLKSLNLHGNPISDRSVPTLSGFKSLTYLELNNTRVSDHGVALLRQALPGCNVDLTFRNTSLPEPVSLLPLNNASCPHEVYKLPAPGSALTGWFTRPIGRLTGTLGWSQSPKGRNYIGPFGQEAVSLHLDDLPAHKNVQVEIELWVIGSWDGDGALGPGPDIIDIDVPNVGRLMHSTFFNNDEGSGKDWTLQTYPDPYPQPYPYGHHLAYTGASEVRSLGFTEPWDGVLYHRDAVYQLKYTFAHTGSEFDIVISGLNVPGSSIEHLVDDEHWGIGNVSVKTD